MPTGEVLPARGNPSILKAAPWSAPCPYLYRDKGRAQGSIGQGSIEIRAARRDKGYRLSAPPGGFLPVQYRIGGVVKEGGEESI